MFENLTLNQLTELRTALWNHYDTEYTAYSEALQEMETGSGEMTAAISRWEARREDIKAMQAEVEAEITKRARASRPIIRRR